MRVGARSMAEHHRAAYSLLEPSDGSHRAWYYTRYQAPGLYQRCVDTPCRGEWTRYPGATFVACAETVSVERCGIFLTIAPRTGGLVSSQSLCWPEGQNGWPHHTGRVLGASYAWPCATGSAAEASAGDSLGLIHTIFERKYRVDRLVVEGGFGIVYKAHHLALAVPVALKILRPALRADDDTFVELMSQFLEEANLLSRLRRSSVAAVMDAGVSSLGGAPAGLPWMALEWMEGETLRAHLARRRGQGGRTPAQAMELLRPVLETIAEAHELNIAHRDLKPSNIMLVPEKGGVTTRVLDFGIAKMMSPDGDAASNGETSTGSPRRAFTAVSAAPEQLSGARTGPWTDVYALGLLLTEVLIDRSPVEARDAHERYRVAFAMERPTPGRAGVDVGSWEAVLNRALAVRPADRPRDARALLDQLDAALAPTAGTAATANEATAPAGRLRRIGSRVLFALAALSTLTIAGASLTWRSRRRAILRSWWSRRSRC